MTSEKRKAIVAFVATHDWSYQLVADRFGVTRNQIAGVLFRHRYPVRTAKSPRGRSLNKIGTGYRSGLNPAHTVCSIRKGGECNMELTRAERRERLKGFHADIAHRAALLLLPRPEAIKPEAMPAETDPPVMVMLPPIPNELMAEAAELAFPSWTNQISVIQKAVCKEFGITRIDLLSASRTKDVVLPRQIAMYLCRKLGGRSLPEIGRRFAGRDHTTILSNFKKIDGMVNADPVFKAKVAGIAESVGGFLE